MSSIAIRRIRNSLTAVAVTSALAWAAPAVAATPRPEAGPNVDFTGGGLGVLLCASKPAAPSITVGAETKLQLTNRLGQAATLRIDGADSASVANGDTVEVQFHRGPVNVTMIPQCPLDLSGGSGFQTLTVQVTPAAPAPAPSPTRATPKPAQTGGTSGTAPKPQNTTGSTGNTGANTPNGSADLPALPADPLFPGDLGTLPSAGPSPSNFDAPATVLGEDGSPAQKLQANNVPLDKGPIGLLAIIATVCVVGVSAGAIRAIITQRAARAEFA